MKLKLTLLASAASLALASPALAADPATQAEIEQLKALVAAQSAQLAAQAERIRRLEEKQTANAPAQAVSSRPPGQATPDAPGATAALADAASSPTFQSTRGSDTTIGGYGEIAYNGYLKDRSRNQADLKRFVLFFGHRFDDRLSFMSEAEWEHAVTSADDHGEAEIEQAYLNYQFTPSMNVKAGLFLMPFGFINRSHEPPVFYGVERNEVERRIIPTTWREGGVSVWGTTSFGLAYDFGITTGFDFAKLDDAGAPLLATHQELQLAHAANLSVYGSLEYSLAPGILVGGAIFTGNSGHSNADFKSDPSGPDFAGVRGRVTLWDMHARIQRSGFDLEALYARGSIANSNAIDRVILAYNQSTGSERPIVPGAFSGWLVQGAYTIQFGGQVTLSPFTRYERFNTQARLPLGLTSDPANRDQVWTTGFSFKPLDQVVVKFDYQKFVQNSGNDRVNLGLGYMF